MGLLLFRFVDFSNSVEILGDAAEMFLGPLYRLKTTENAERQREWGRVKECSPLVIEARFYMEYVDMKCMNVTWPISWAFIKADFWWADPVIDHYGRQPSLSMTRHPLIKDWIMRIVLCLLPPPFSSLFDNFNNNCNSKNGYNSQLETEHKPSSSVMAAWLNRISWLVNRFWGSSPVFWHSLEDFSRFFAILEGFSVTMTSLPAVWWRVSMFPIMHCFVLPIVPLLN